VISNIFPLQRYNKFCIYARVLVKNLQKYPGTPQKIVFLPRNSIRCGESGGTCCPSIKHRGIDNCTHVADRER